jgi:hypothetical protein
MPMKPREPISTYSLWKFLVSSLKESSIPGIRIKNGFAPNGEEAIMLRANGDEIFWILITQIDDECADEAVTTWEETPDL